MAKEFKLTAARIAELNEELNTLKTTRMQEVVEDIKEARSQGDLSENSEYDEARNEQAKLFGRINEIEDILAHAVIIEDVVTVLWICSRVKCLYHTSFWDSGHEPDLAVAYVHQTAKKIVVFVVADCWCCIKNRGEVNYSLQSAFGKLFVHRLLH